MEIPADKHGKADKATSQRGIQTWMYPNIRQVRPKYQWAQDTSKEMWETIKEGSAELRGRVFGEDCYEIEHILREHAQFWN